MDTPRRSSFERSTLVVSLGALFLVLWLLPDGLQKTAQAQVPNANLVRKQQLAETKKTNQLLTEIRSLLASGGAKMQLVQAPTKR